MGGFLVYAQPFGVYQAIDWLSSNSATLQDQLNGAKRIRQMIAKEKTDDVIKLGIVSRLVDLLKKTDFIQLQAEIIATLADVVTKSSFLSQLVLRKALPTLVELLEKSMPEEFKIDVVWTFANIASDSADSCDKLLEAGVHLIIVKLLESPKNLDFERNCIWLLSNLFRYNRSVIDFEIIAICTQTLLKYLNHIDSDIICHTCSSLKYISKGSLEQQNLLVETVGVCQRLVELISHQCSQVVLDALLVCINITAGTFQQAEALLRCGFIPALSKKLEETNEPRIIKNVCFAFSNIAAGNSSQIQELANENIFKQLFKKFPLIEKPSQIEVLHVINNVLCCGNTVQVKLLASSDLMEICYHGLFFDENEALKQSLEGILFSQKHYGLVIDNKVISRIEHLRRHDALETQFLAKAIIQNFNDSFYKVH